MATLPRFGRFAIPWVPLAHLSAFALLIVSTTSYYSRTFVDGLQSTHVEAFSTAFIPLLALFVHFALLSFLPFRVYAVLVVIDSLVLLGIATSHTHSGDNLDVHVMLANWREGLDLKGAIWSLIPKRLAAGVTLIAGLQLALARRLTLRRLNRRVAAFLLVLVIPPLSVALHREPIQRAALSQDYTLCVKLYGYYSAMLADLVFSGVVPSQETLHEGFLAAQRPVPDDWCVPNAEQRSVLAIQVESLDYQIVDSTWQGEPVAPFLNELRHRSVFLRLDPSYTLASSSSGADFQLLTGKLPHPSYPVYGLKHIDYSDALPRLFSRRGVDSFGYVGVTSNFFSQGAGFQRAGFRRHFSQPDYPYTSSRWGIDDESFFDFNAQALNERSARAFDLMITVGSHAPFDYVEHHAFAAPGRYGRYINSINHVDAQLGALLRRLRGSYLVVIYGDHSAFLSGPHYSSTTDGVGYVPAFVFSMDDGEIQRPRLARPYPDGLTAPPIAALYWLLRNSALEGCATG